MIPRSPRLIVQRVAGAWCGGEQMESHFAIMTARVSSAAIAKRMLAARLDDLGVKNYSIEVIR